MLQVGSPKEVRTAILRVLLTAMTILVLLAGVLIVSRNIRHKLFFFLPNWYVREQISRLVRQYPRASWGIAIADQATGEILEQINSDHFFAPASVGKLFSTAAALDEYGADHRFTTPVYRRGKVISGGRLRGDLILRAVGDPNLTGRIDAAGSLHLSDVDHIYANSTDKASVPDVDPLIGLDDLARQVVATGISEVRDVLVDDRLFDHAQGVGSGPAQLTPVVVNDNLIDLIITPGSRVGDSAKVTTRPPSAYLKLDIEVETVEPQRGADIETERVAPHHVTVRGHIQIDRSQLLRVVEVDDPAEFARTLFIEQLGRHGVRVEANSTAPMLRDRLPPEASYESLPVIARHVSAPFATTIRVILKSSHNLEANLLPLLLAIRKGQRSLDEGLRVEGDFLQRAGVNPDSVFLNSGSGGDHADYVTPRAAVLLLCAMARHPLFAAYRNSLPVLGVDGTLAADPLGPLSPLHGNLSAKTGTMYWAAPTDNSLFLKTKALAGYLTAHSGRKLVVALFANDAPIRTVSEVSRYGRALEDVCEIIYWSF